MQMQSERRIDQPRRVVWAALTDADVLRQCLPGCRRLVPTADDTYDVETVARVGAMQAVFRGTLRVSDSDPPHGYRLSGEGNGGPAGFAKGSANVRLLEDGDGTRLTYTVDAVVGGKLAQLGSRLIDAAALQMADAFFERFAALAAPRPADDERVIDTPQPAEAKAETTRGLRPLVWVPGLIVVTLAIVLIFGRP
ncbi:MAG: carbon monoxide dehydrogenase subunit G [Rhodospirillales bacterium]